MDGAVYVLSKQTSDPQERSTNRKPDGFWFDAMPDDQGRPVQDQYKFDRNADGGNHLTLVYRYDGQVTDTGVEFEVDENPRGDVTCGDRPTMPDEVAEHVRLTPRGAE